jgi:hypothetical protein
MLQGAFPTCEFCNLIEHLLKSRCSGDKKDSVSEEAIDMLHEMRLLHIEQQGELLIYVAIRINHLC